MIGTTKLQKEVIKMKKRFILLTVCVGLVTLAITGGSIIAHGGDRPAGHNRASITDRVADLLGLESVELQSAFDQAIREQQNAKMATRLDRMVSNNLVTRDEADDILAWYESRANIRIVDRILLALGDKTDLQRKLDRMVEKGHLDQSEVDQIMAWLQGRPEVVDSIEKPDKRHSHNKWGKGRRHQAGEARSDQQHLDTWDGSFRAPSDSLQVSNFEHSILYR